MTETEFEKLSFEDALMQLENIVRELEAGRIKLDDAVNAYEKAVTYSVKDSNGNISN